MEGQLVLIRESKEVFEYQFTQPSGRSHKIDLKEGIQFSMLE